MGMKLIQQHLGGRVIPMAVNQGAASTEACGHAKSRCHRSSTHGDMGGSLNDLLIRRELRHEPEMVERGSAYADNLHG